MKELLLKGYRRVTTRLPDAASWVDRFSQKLAAFGLAVLAIGILYGLLLFGLHLLWGLFAETHVGWNYRAGHPEGARLIDAVLAPGPFRVALWTLWLGTTKALAWGALGRLLFLTRLAYENRSLLTGTFLLGLPLAWLMAADLGPALGLAPRAAFYLSLLPALALPAPTLDLPTWLIPEADDVVRLARDRWRRFRAGREAR